MEEVTPLGLSTKDLCVPVRHTHMEPPPKPQGNSALWTEARLGDLRHQDPCGEASRKRKLYLGAATESCQIKEMEESKKRDTER